MNSKILLKRLKVMGPAEMSRRAIRRLGHRLIENRIEREADEYASENTIAALLSTPIQIEPPRNDSNPVHDTILKHAESALSGRITIFGNEIDLGSNPNWLAVPGGGGDATGLETLPAWSENYADTRLDIRSIWELNRLQVLVCLGRAWRLTGREEFAARAANLIKSWCEQNPFCKTVNWTSALEVSLRAISMLFAVNSLRDSAVFQDKKLRGELGRQFFLHGQYIAANLSPLSSGFNHLAGESAGLALLGDLLPEISHAARWRIEGLALLRQCMHRLILSDGGGLEGSLHYTSFTCRLAAVTTLLYGRDAEDVLGREGARRLCAAYRFLSEMTDGGRAASEYGDSDDAYLPGLPPGDAAGRYGGTLNLLWLLCGDEPLRHEFTGDPDSIWLAGADRIAQRLESVDRVVPEPLVSFESSGHYVARPAPGVFARFECGHWGDGATWAHSHADRLSFSLFLDGCPVVVDPGTGAYLSDREMREYFRSSLAHSTGVVDGGSQGNALASFMWESEIRSSLSEATQTDLQIVLEGKLESEYFADGERPVGHHRRLCFFRADSRLVVEDFFRADSEHRVEINFTLHPSCRAELHPDGKAVIGYPGDTLVLSTDPGGAISLHRGERNPLRGWYSKGFGRTEPCWQVTVVRKITGNTWINTELNWSGSNQDKTQ